MNSPCAIPHKQNPILLVEDDEDEAFLITHRINHEFKTNYPVKNVAGIKDALIMLSEENFSIIVLDLNLNDTQGICSLQAIHNLKTDIPIIVRSDLNSRKLMDEVILSGAQDFIVKGGHRDTLIEYIIEETVLPPSLLNDMPKTG
jgi:DNA-binding NtrC family response regulator